MLETKKVSSLENALTLLDSYTMDLPEIKISEAAEKMGIAKSTAHRLLTTLESEGFVTKDIKSNHYILGGSILSLSSVMISNNKICQAAIPVLEDLVELSGESAHVAKLEKNRVVYLYKIDCQHSVRLLSHHGKENPAYCTSSGQAVLAFQPEDAIDAVIKEELHPYTNHTITSPEKLKQALHKIKESNYAVSAEELHDGVTSIGAPIRNRNGKVIASVNIAGPVQRINNRTIPKHIKLVKEAATRISHRLS